MSKHTPNSWVILAIDGDQPYFKVLGGWSGGYLEGDCWRLNSGITKMEEDEKYYYFHGYSGSVYKCYKNSQHLSGMMHSVYSRLQEMHGDKIELIDVNEMILEDTNE